MSNMSIPRVPNVRARLILARLDWIRKQHGEPAIERVLSTLGKSQLNAVRGAVTPSQWVPFDAFVAFTEAIDAVLGRGDLDLVRPLARHAARTNLPTLYKIFYKVGSLDYILSKAAAVWSAHYDSGTASTANLTGGHRFRIERFATPHKIHCLTIQGWAEETGVLVGVKLQAVRHIVCRLHGADTCEFDLIDST